MSKTKQVLSQIIAWLTLTSTAPFIFYVWPSHPYKILTFACLLVMVLSFLQSKKRIQIDQNITNIILVQILYYAIITSLYYNYSNLNFCIQFVALFIIITFIDNFIGFKNFARSYINIILIMGIGGVITLFIHVFIGISPIFEIKYSALGTTYFLGLTSTNDFYNSDSLRMLRFAGFFDEPGAFALFSIFAIILNKIYFNNLKIEKYLILVTIFTFSMAFFIIIAMYLLLFYLKISHLKYLALVCVGITALYISLSNYKGDNKSLILLNAMTFERFKLDDAGNLAGNNRYEASVNDKKLFLENPLWGEQTENKVRGSNVYSIIANHGLFGAFFYYAFLVYFLYRIVKLTGEKRTLFLKLFILVVANFFHRPEFSAVLILLVIYSMIRYLDLDSDELESIKINNHQY